MVFINGKQKLANRAWSNFLIIWRNVASEHQLTIDSCVTHSYSLETKISAWKFEFSSLLYEKCWIMTILEIPAGRQNKQAAEVKQINR